ncbi:MAG: Secreted protein, partial [uncultured Rubrobacteraceae bacterium]
GPFRGTDEGFALRRGSGGVLSARLGFPAARPDLLHHGEVDPGRLRAGGAPDRQDPYHRGQHQQPALPARRGRRRRGGHDRRARPDHDRHNPRGARRRDQGLLGHGRPLPRHQHVPYRGEAARGGGGM